MIELEKKECGVRNKNVKYKIVAKEYEDGFYLHIYNMRGKEITQEVDSSLDGPFMSTGDAERFVEDRFIYCQYLGFFDERSIDNSDPNPYTEAEIKAMQAEVAEGEAYYQEYLKEQDDELKRFIAGRE